MKNQAKLNLNLASTPMRNKRFFFLLSIGLVITFVVTSAVGGRIYFQYRGKHVEITEKLTRVSQYLLKSRREETQYSTLVEENTASFAGTADYINSLIYRKSFPWMDFFEALESSLPESSYIVSLNPSPADGKELEVRFKAVFSGLNELLKFISRLDSKGFEDINIVSESQTEEGFLLSEISVRYERRV